MLSLPHLVVLFVVALVIFGPQKLPELARMLGKATAEFRKMTSDFRYALEDEVRELDRQTRIRDEEIAAAANAAKLPFHARPSRRIRDAEGVSCGDRPGESPRTSPQAEPAPEEAVPPQAVSVPQEKPSDDHTAV